MIRCVICGRWIGRIRDPHKELKHIENHKLVKAYDKPVDPYLGNNFEVVRL